MILLATTGVLAIAGGLLLAVAPDGHLLRLSSELLAGTPFASYLVPGLILLLVVGGTQLAAAAAVQRHDPRDLRAALIAAGILAGWIAIQVVILDTIMWLQPLFFLVAAIEAMLVAANVPRKPSGKAGKAHAAKPHTAKPHHGKRASRTAPRD